MKNYRVLPITVILKNTLTMLGAKNINVLYLYTPDEKTLKEVGPKYMAGVIILKDVCMCLLHLRISHIIQHGVSNFIFQCKNGQRYYLKCHL